jgi:hypothetical protein
LSQIDINIKLIYIYKHINSTQIDEHSDKIMSSTIHSPISTACMD